MSTLGGPDTWALLVGVAEYEELNDLPAVARNLTGLRESLISIGVNPNQIIVTSEPQQPKEISGPLKQIAGQAEGVLFVYFSGHGLLDEYQNFYLSVARSSTDFLPETSLPFDRVRQLVRDARARCRVVVLDCCFSGRAIETAMSTTEDLIKESVGVYGAYTLTSTSASSVSLAPPGAHYTAFTEHLLDLLSGENDSILGGLTLHQLDLELQRRLRAAGLPRAKSRADDLAGDLIIRKPQPKSKSRPRSRPKRGLAQKAPEQSTTKPSTRLDYSDHIQRRNLIPAGIEKNPHAVLGSHLNVFTTWCPGAESVTLISGESETDLSSWHSEGIFGANVLEPPGDYKLRVTRDGQSRIIDDPYRWSPTLSDSDLALIGEGRHQSLWEVLGSHVRTFDTPGGTVEGASFAVWAPNARGVKVTGDFDDWQARAYPMRSLGPSGVWEIFIPGVQVGSRYKYHILGADGRWREKADPLAFATEIPPANASIVTESRHNWGDNAWIDYRAPRTWRKLPMSIYEVHAGSWRQGLGYRELADELIDYVVAAGFTHIEFMPLAEHPLSASWGYQVTSYFAPTARFGSPDDFRYLVDKAHQAEIGVIVDWVPAHFPKDEWGLARFDGTPLYEYSEPASGQHVDLDTLVFDFGSDGVRNFLIASAMYWCIEFHVDGLRTVHATTMLNRDFVNTEQLSNLNKGFGNLEAKVFLQNLNKTLYSMLPGICSIADGVDKERNDVTRPTHLDGLGFGFEWNKEWAVKTLSHISRGADFRSNHHGELPQLMLDAYSERYILALAHDEVSPGNRSLLLRVPGDRWQQLATLRAYLAYMWAHPGKKLLFMGSEFAQEAEWVESRSLNWWHLDDPAHRGVFQLVTDLNTHYRKLEALWSRDDDPSGFQWIDVNDASRNVLSFLRYGQLDDSLRVQALACITNLAVEPHHGYQVGLPRGGRWREILNTDSAGYGGSGVGNSTGSDAVAQPWQQFPFSVEISVPPLGTIYMLSESV